MFYCDPCGTKNLWPIGFHMSYGPCEICGKTCNCNSFPAKSLPIPPEVSEEE